MFPYHAVGGTGAGAARARCGWRLIRRSRYRRTLATFLAALTERLLRHPARILVSSARLPSPSPGTRLASTTTTQLASLHSCHSSSAREAHVAYEAAACVQSTTDGCALQMQPCARPVYPRAWQPRSCASGRALCLPLIGAASLPAAPERPRLP